MTVRQIFEKKQLQTSGETVCNSMHDAMFDIDFISEGEPDETQFTVLGTNSLDEIKEILADLFAGFCRENGIHDAKVISVTYVGQDPHCGHSGAAWR